MRCRVLLLALTAVAPFAAAQTAPPGWASYQVLMWSTGSPVDMQQWISRLQELGATGEQCTGCNPAPYRQANFGYYVENLVPELGFLNNRSSLYSADFNAYFNCDSGGKNCNMSAAATHDKTHLIRQPSLSDPRYWNTAQPRLDTLVGDYVGRQPLLYQLRDELSIGSYTSPFDYCFDPNTLTAFREWLKNTYGSLDALNQEWATGFKTWDDVIPFTTYEIKDRERAALAGGKAENYAPWADHRAFMDITFSGAIDRLRGFIRRLDNITPVGIEGLQMPSTWGGYDLWRLSQAADWVEPYDIAGSREIFRSFLPQGSVILTTVFGSDFVLQPEVFHHAHEAVAHPRDTAPDGFIGRETPRPGIFILAGIKHPMRAQARLRVVDGNAVIQSAQAENLGCGGLELSEYPGQAAAALGNGLISRSLQNGAIRFIVPHDGAAIAIQQQPPETAPDGIKLRLLRTD